MPFMPAAHQEPGSSLLRAYRLPAEGVNVALPAHLIGEAALRQGHNVWLHTGALRSRPGLHSDASQGGYAALGAGLAIGSILYVNRANVKTPVVATTSGIAMLTATGWQPLHSHSAQRSHPIRFTTLENNRQVSLLAASADIGLLHRPEGAAFTSVALPSGLAQSAIVDIATVATRVVIAQPPYTIAWSNSLAPTVFQDTSSFVLADTTDRLVAIKPLGILGFAIYKEGSIYLGVAQSGADAFAFKPEFYGESEGPCCASAIASVNNMHIYMTPSGRIGLFTGTQQTFLADGLWPFLQDDLDKQFLTHVNACFDYQLNTVFIFYPRKGDSGACHGLVTLSLPYPTAGIQSYAAFTGTTHLDVSNTLSVSLFAATQQPFVFAATQSPAQQQVLRLDKAHSADMTLPFACTLQPGLTGAPQAVIHKSSLELQAQRGDAHGVVSVFQVFSHLLETPDGILDDKDTLLDLTIVTPSQFLGFSIAATYLGFLIEWMSDQAFFYYGCDLYGRPTA
jgi:hypothetical protein